VDVDESGQLERKEFEKMIRMFRQWEHDQQKDAWDQMLGENHLMHKEQLFSLCDSLSLLDGKVTVEDWKLLDGEYIPAMDPDGPILIDYCGFVEVAARLTAEARIRFRNNGGFSSKEVQDLARCFNRYDADGSGDISNKELIFLIEELFPQMANSATMRPRLLEIMVEVDGNGNGSLDFNDFIRLMAQFRELQDAERIAKEATAVQDTGFSSTEVAEFRELFLVADDGSGELSLKEVTNMINMITPLGDILREEMTKLFHEVTGKQCGVEGLRDQADFPEFLWFMSKLLENNFANIKDKTKKFAESMI